MKLDPNRVNTATRAFEKLRKGNARSPRNIVLAILAVLYIVSPFDIIPDWFPFIGWLDDIGVLSTLLYFIFRRPFVQAEQDEEKK